MSFDFDWGKNAVYVGWSFGLTGVILAWMIVDSLARARAWRSKFETLDKERRS